MSTTLFVGGRIHTPAASPTSALVVDGDHVAWLGDDEAAVGQWGDVDEVVQLDGALVTPAFVDAHVHTTSTGLSLTGLDLSSAASVEELLRQLETHCRATSGGVIVGHGWDESSWPVQRAPTRQELDRASYGSVVYLSRIDVHSCVASSALLAITPEAKGQAGYDDSGWLKQQAHHTVRAAAFES
ncbi:MAG: amidohydrolase family protein, partial [Candidatus Nanopelagicales bacterium]